MDSDCVCCQWNPRVRLFTNQANMDLGLWGNVRKNLEMDPLGVSENPGGPGESEKKRV